MLMNDLVITRKQFFFSLLVMICATFAWKPTDRVLWRSSTELNTFYLRLLRACDIAFPTPPVHPWAGALYLLHAGDRLLLPQWRGRTPAPHEGGDRWHPSGHHRPECLWVSALHVRQTAPAPVGALWERFRENKNKLGSLAEHTGIVYHFIFRFGIIFNSTFFVLNRYGGLTVGNIQKSIPASFGRKTPPMVRKIAVRSSAQVRRVSPPQTGREVH